MLKKLTILLALILLPALGVQLTEPKLDKIAETTATKATVTKVIDGDTVELSTGERLRYIGMDTPELKSKDCYSQEATARNKELVEGKEVELEKDVSETDRYGRLLRYVHVEGQMVNRILLQEGFAKVATFPPDVRYQETFLEDERQARENGRGLWGDVCAVDIQELE